MYKLDMYNLDMYNLDMYNLDMYNLNLQFWMRKIYISCCSHLVFCLFFERIKIKKIKNLKSQKFSH